MSKQEWKALYHTYRRLVRDHDCTYAHEAISSCSLAELDIILAVTSWDFIYQVSEI